VPGPTNFNTVERAIFEAYENCAIIPDGGTPNSEQYAKGFNRLNSLVNFLQTRGLKLFAQTDIPLPLVAGTNLYKVGVGQAGINMAKPLRVPLAYFLNASGTRVPMTPMSWQEWVNLQPQTTSPGQPVNYFVDKQAAFLGVYVWPTPDATSAAGSVHLVFQTQIPLGTGLTDDISFPPEWFTGIAWALSNELCTGQPDSIVARCKAKSDEFLNWLDGWDVEDAQTFFTPDARNGYYNNDFQ
jgi:hypothetical protein